MRSFVTLVFLVLFPLSAIAQETDSADDTAMIRPAGDSDLSEFLWVNRPVIVFADSPADPRYGEQIERLKQGLDMLADRGVVILTDTDPAARSPVRKKLRPRGFQLVLIDKDGVIKLRRPSPRSVREISASIDKTPSRQREIRERRGDG